jgi:OmpA-OmpF porin, OOP family
MTIKTKTHHLIAAGTMLLIGAANASAQTSPVYLDGELGASFPQSLTFKNSGGTKATFNPGVRADIVLGYNLSDCFAVEFNTGAIWNSVDKIGGESLSSEGASFNLYQIPFLANLVYKTPVWKGFSGYIGAGAGGEAAILGVNVPGHSASDNDFTFAYQGLAGVKYAICKNTEIGLGYKFLGTLDHHWTIAGEGISTEALYTHSIMATLTYKF